MSTTRSSAPSTFLDALKRESDFPKLCLVGFGLALLALMFQQVVRFGTVFNTKWNMLPASMQGTIEKVNYYGYLVCMIVAYVLLIIVTWFTLDKIFERLAKFEHRLGFVLIFFASCGVGAAIGGLAIDPNAIIKAKRDVLEKVFGPNR